MATTRQCLLENVLFSSMGAALFRRAESDDGVVVAVFNLGKETATVPLKSLVREFTIAGESADGEMLGLVEAALDYVPCVRVGDMLPTEVLNGKASW